MGIISQWLQSNKGQLVGALKQLVAKKSHGLLSNLIKDAPHRYSQHVCPT